jgi:hypothetical protein
VLTPVPVALLLPARTKLGARREEGKGEHEGSGDAAVAAGSMVYHGIGMGAAAEIVLDSFGWRGRLSLPIPKTGADAIMVEHDDVFFSLEGSRNVG